MVYQVSILKTTEQDNFETGCDPETFTDHGEVYTFKSSDLETVKHRIVNNMHLDLNDAEEFEGRLDVSILEDAAGFKANKNQIEAWKHGRIKLYAATYSVYLTKVEIKELNAKLLK